MKTTDAFETKIRTQTFPSLDAARKYAKESPLTAEYVIELLCAKGVLEVQEDGSVRGKVRGPAREGGKGQNVSATYKETWPDQDVLLGILREGPIRFRKLQAALTEKGETAAHWFVLHALWHLSEKGVVKQDDKKRYVVADWVEPEEQEEEKEKDAPGVFAVTRMDTLYRLIKQAMDGGARTYADAVKLAVERYRPKTDGDILQDAAKRLVAHGFIQIDPIVGNVAFLKEPGPEGEGAPIEEID